MSTMSEIPKTKFIGLLVSVFTFVCPFLLSYPFFMLYLIFSLPYILEILSFLSPVFVTAFILFTAFLPNLINKISEQSPGNQFHPFCTIFLPKFLLYAYDAILEIFLPKIDNGDEEFYPVEVLELYKTVFETFMTDETENHVGNSEERPDEKIVQAVESSVLMILRNNEQECIRSKDETFTGSSKYDFLDDVELERPKSVIKETTFQEFNIDCKEVDKSFDKQKTVAELVKPESIIKMHSRRRSARTNTDFTDEDGRGRMSVKEKEWKKTLACKLFEDKHSNNVEDCEGEGMDLLWETHEEERSVETPINEMNNENEGSEGKIIGYYEDEEDEEEVDIQVCCLHAFKFSSRKMSMGVGGRNLARFSKVVKGIRWLRSVTKHGNKMNNNQDKFQIHK